MFCYQCEQTSKGEGCQTLGVCGKDETTATLQDLLIHAIKGISMYAHRAAKLGASDAEIDAFTIQAIFATLTNVNFDPDRLVELIHQAIETRVAARKLYEHASGCAGIAIEQLSGPSTWIPAATLDGLLEQGRHVTLPVRFLTEGQEISNLKELLMYGVKGVAAYAFHALALGAGDPASVAKIHEILDFLTHSAPTPDQLLAKALAVGELNYRVMEILDKAHTETFGHPQPAKVRLQPRKGKAILVSGHDLHDLYALLEQTKGLGIQVYTHGEMLPAHGYPKLKAFGHLAGNYGGAWVDQADEFAEFPGAILMTSNCIQQPKEVYKQRIFTSGAVAWPGVQHIANQDFSPVIAAALEAAGYEQDGSDEEITVGFGHNAVLNVAGKVIKAVKGGAIRHFFLIGGCDGARSGRSYYTELAESIPNDCLILTLACGNSASTSSISEKLADYPACSTSASATTPTQRCRLRWRWPRHSSAASTICLSRWFCRGTSKKPSRCC